MPTTKYSSLKPFGAELIGSMNASEIRRQILEQGLVVLRNFEIQDPEGLINFAQSLSHQQGGLKEKLLHWDFGPIMDMKYSGDAKNYLFSKEAVPFHWDGAFHKEPLFLMFYCKESKGSGGETLFCDTSMVYESWDSAKRNEALDIILSYETEKLAHYGGKISIPLVQKHPITKQQILRYADEVKTDLNPVTRKLERGKPSILASLAEALPKATYGHTWQTDDLVLADNFRLIHGRRPLGNNLKRKFHRIQIL